MFAAKIMLDVQDISINYGVCAVVQNISFSLQTGKIVALLGENGAGKTTVLKSLNGGLPVASGEIRLNGKSLKDFSRREIAQKIAVVAQETETKFPVSVLEFVLSGRFAHGAAFGSCSAKFGNLRFENIPKPNDEPTFWRRTTARSFRPRISDSG